MKLLIYTLICLLVAVAAGFLMKQDSGQVVLALSEYTIQTSLSFFIVLLFALFFMFYFLLRALIEFLDIPKKFRRWKKTRGHAKSEYFLTQGYLALIEGNWSTAEKLFRKGASYSRLPMINYIGAARAAQQLGAVDRRDSYLRQAYADDPDSEYAVGVVRAELQLKQEQTEQAYATLRHIDADRPGHNQVKLMMLEASSQLKDWQQALILLEDLENRGVLSVENVRAKQLQAYAHILNSASKTGDIKKLNEVWHRIPKKLKKEFYLMEVYINGRIQYPETTDCEIMIRRVIKHNPDPALVRLYGQVQGEYPAKQLSFIERLLKEYPSDSIILLTAGRLYKRAELWGKAKSCLQRSLEIRPTAEVYHELATLFESQGDENSAIKYFQEGLALAANFNAELSTGNSHLILELPENPID